MTDAPLAATLSDAHLAFDGRPALDGLSLDVRPGEMVGLVGPDGAGKTTAIRCLLGLLPLDSGSARVFGLDPVRQGDEVKRVVGYLAQRFTLYGDLTVQENVDFFGALHGVKDRGMRRERLLELTHLAEFRGRRADALSGGMQKKLALACTLIHTPRVLFLDEPTSGVDPLSRRELWKLLSGLVVEGLSVLLSTPYLDEAERCARVALVRDGRTLAFDAAPELKAALGARVVEVVCSPVRRARELLAVHPRVQDVRLYGDRVHVFATQPGDDLSDVVRSLEGVHVTAVRTIEPSLEDVFIRRVTDAQAAEAARG